MADYSSTTANIPEAVPRTLVPDKTKDDATDRDADNPTEWAGAHAEALVNEVIALYKEGFPDALGRVLDAGGLDVTVGAGKLYKSNGTVVAWSQVAAQALADNATNYVEVSAAGVVSDNTTAFSAGAVPLAQVVTSGGDITSVTDKRAAYSLVPKCNLAATVAPTADEDSGDGYVVGSLWLDTTADKAYICMDATAAAAVWTRLGKADSEIDHGSLSGLTDVADHPGYLPKAGGTMTGALHLDGAAAGFTEYDNGDSGVAITIDWTRGNKQKVKMTANCTFTFTPPAHATDLKLAIEQDASGSRVPTWPATVKWPGGTAPTLSGPAGDDVLAWYYNGTNYRGASSLNYS